MADFTDVLAEYEDAELDRRDPERVKMRPTDPSGFREAWDLVERRWTETVARARLLDPVLWDEMPETPGVPRDRDVRPSLDEVLVVRQDRMRTVREVIDGLSDESLASTTEPVYGPGWPPARGFLVAECLLTILNEEWEHRSYAERDLGVLERQRS